MKTGQTEAKYFEIRFLDTIAFMNTSIEKLVKSRRTYLFVERDGLCMLPR